MFSFLFRPSGDKYEQGVCITLGGLTVLVVCVNVSDTRLELEMRSVPAIPPPRIPVHAGMLVILLTD